MAVISQDGQVRQDRFVDDIRSALRAWSLDPRLPALTLAVFLSTAVPSLLLGLNPVFWPVALAALPIQVFGLGFYGTQRLWYLRLFRAQPISLRDVWWITWSMAGRFLALGLLVGIPFFALLSLTFALARRSAAPAPVFTGLRLLLFALPLLAVDLALTFVTPALSFTTTRVRNAFRIGLRMIPQAWPAAAFYVLFPPLAIQLVGYVPGFVGIRSWWLSYLLAVPILLASLAAKGATAAFYLRRAQVPDEGSLRGENPPPV
jgi:hypothetical protein